MPWDEKIPENMMNRIIEALSYFFKMETIEFARKVVFAEAEEIRFKIFFDGSKDLVGISVVVRSTLPNKKVIYRLLCNKSKLVADDVTTAPRSELTACLVSSRVYSLIKEELRTFLAEYKGKISFEIIGDSMIVLNQIKKDSFHFNTYAAARIQEICENTLNYPIIWSHICSQENLSDLLTRKYLKDPCELQWAQPSLKISEQTFEVTKIPM